MISYNTFLQTDRIPVEIIIRLRNICMKAIFDNTQKYADILNIKYEELACLVNNPEKIVELYEQPQGEFESLDVLHLLWMLSKIEERELTVQAEHRWLGWVQAALTSKNLTTVNAERDMTRMFFQHEKHFSAGALPTTTINSAIESIKDNATRIERVLKGSNNLRTHRYHQTKGEYYGYPECCIGYFVRTKDKDNRNNECWTKWIEAGFVPCPDHVVYHYLDMQNLINQNRICPEYFYITQQSKVPFENEQ